MHLHICDKCDTQRVFVHGCLCELVKPLHDQRALDSNTKQRLLDGKDHHTFKHILLDYLMFNVPEL